MIDVRGSTDRHANTERSETGIIRRIVGKAGIPRLVASQLRVADLLHKRNGGREIHCVLPQHVTREDRRQMVDSSR